MYKISSKHFIFFKTNSLIQYINTVDNKSFYLKIKNYRFFYITKKIELNDLFF